MNAFETIVPPSAIANPRIEYIHYVEQGESQYLRTFTPYDIEQTAPLGEQFVCDENGCMFYLTSPDSMKKYYTVIERMGEFASVGDTQIGVGQTRGVAPDAQRYYVDKQRSGTVSRMGMLDHWVDYRRFTPEMHEYENLERIASNLAKGVGELEELTFELNDEGKRVLSLYVRYDGVYWDVAWQRATFSLDDQGLALASEEYVENRREDREMFTLLRSVTDVAFSTIGTPDGRISLPGKRLYSEVQNGAMKRQHLLLVEAERLRVNEPIPDEAFRITLTGHETLTQYVSEGGGAIYRGVDTLPSEFHSLIRKVDSEEAYESIKEEWDGVFAAIGGAGGPPPYTGVELARYAQHPVPKTYSGTPWRWESYLQFGVVEIALAAVLLLLLVGGFVVRYVIPRRERRTPQPV